MWKVDWWNVIRFKPVELWKVQFKVTEKMLKICGCVEAKF